MATAMTRIQLALRAVLALAAVAAPIWLLHAPTHTPKKPPQIPLRIESPPAAVGPAIFPVSATTPGPAPLAGSGPPAPIGIVGRLPDDVQAMVRLADGTIRTLSRGDSAGGWTLSDIEPDRLHFSRDGQERVLVLPPRESAGQ